MTALVHSTIRKIGRAQELNREVVELLIAHSAGELVTLVDHKYVQQPDVLRQNAYSQMNEALFAFLDKLAREYEAQRRK